MNESSGALRYLLAIYLNFVFPLWRNVKCAVKLYAIVKNSFYNTGFVNNSMHAISEMTASLLTSDLTLKCIE